MSKNPLGKKTFYKNLYNPALLFPIPRKKQRKTNSIDSIGFNGYDIWNIYELSWLNNNGKPEVRKALINYSCNSENIVESKSLKLYLNSFNMSKFKNQNDVIDIIKKDLNKILKSEFLDVILFSYNENIKYNNISNKILLDNLNFSTNVYNLDSNLLLTKKSKKTIIERYSNLLKTNCPITNQPDWATVYIKYKSDLIIDDLSLIKYIVSFRDHSDFHESCCEKIFFDIYSLINPDFLVVKCFFNRRGGIEINPVRFSGIKIKMDYNYHYWRQ
jgi:7-cyano-7-deazaguanine reductase